MRDTHTSAVVRQQVRSTVRQDGAGTQDPASASPSTAGHTDGMSSSVASLPATSVVKINAIQVPPGAGEELERRFAQRAGAVEGSPGFLGFQLLRPVAGEDRYFVVTHWADEESFAAWRDGSGRVAHAGERSTPGSSGADLLEFEVILDVAPQV